VLRAAHKSAALTLAGLWAVQVATGLVLILHREFDGALDVGR